MAKLHQLDDKLREFLYGFFEAMNCYEVYECRSGFYEVEQKERDDDFYHNNPFRSDLEFRRHAKMILATYFADDKELWKEFNRSVREPPTFSGYRNFEIGIFKRRSELLVKIWCLDSGRISPMAFTIKNTNGKFQVLRWNYSVARQMEKGDSELPKPMDASSLVEPTPDWQPETWIDRFLLRLFGRR